MHIVGLDIGFSDRRRSNAMAELRRGEVRVVKLNVAERNAELERLEEVDAIAIDAPIVASGCSPDTVRSVEQIFSRGLFQRRCKPGMSHVRGTGRTLREHGAEAARLVADAARWKSDPPFPTVLSHVAVIEAFPNAFLGVMVPDSAFHEDLQVPRGGKFDFLYDQWAEHDLFRQAVTECGLPLETVDTLMSERDHDKRAAFICLLTAAFAVTGRASFIGDTETGYFALPPRELWRSWAKSAVKE